MQEYLSICNCSVIHMEIYFLNVIVRVVAGVLGGVKINPLYNSVLFK